MQTNENSKLIICHQVEKIYKDGKHETKVLNKVDFMMENNELLAIVGSSGSGKSTLLHLLGGLDMASSGDIFFKGMDLAEMDNNSRALMRNQHIGFIYQFHHLLPDFSALENVAMPLLINHHTPKDAENRSKEMLSKVGLSHRINHRPSELSGGERQRVAIARALINNPSLVLADEPTGNLDQRNAQEIFELIKQINSDNKTAFLIVTHDLELAKKMDRQLEMRDGILSKEPMLLGRSNSQEKI